MSISLDGRRDAPCAGWRGGAAWREWGCCGGSGRSRDALAGGRECDQEDGRGGFRWQEGGPGRVWGTVGLGSLPCLCFLSVRQSRSETGAAGCLAEGVEEVLGV